MDEIERKSTKITDKLNLERRKEVACHSVCLGDGLIPYMNNIIIGKCRKQDWVLCLLFMKWDTGCEFGPFLKWRPPQMPTVLESPSPPLPQTENSCLVPGVTIYYGKKKLATTIYNSVDPDMLQFTRWLSLRFFELWRRCCNRLNVCSCNWDMDRAVVSLYVLWRGRGVVRGLYSSSVLIPSPQSLATICPMYIWHSKRRREAVSAWNAIYKTLY